MPPRALTRLRSICLAFPESHEEIAWGAPTFRVKNKLYAMYAEAGNHHGAGREGVWIKARPGNQALMVRDAPTRYFVPPYVGPKGWVGAYLDDAPDWDELRDVLRDAYRMTAPKTLLAKRDAPASETPPKRARAKSTRAAPGAKRAATEPDAEARLAEFLDKYLPEIVSFTKSVRAAMRRRLPGAVEMVYDNYNALVIGYGPSERASDAIFSIVPFPQHVSLCFLQGATLPDPKKILQGSGNVVRHIRLESAATLRRPEVAALIDLACERARVPIDPKAPRSLVIKSVSAKQRPRRPKGL